MYIIIYIKQIFKSLTADLQCLLFEVIYKNTSTVHHEPFDFIIQSSQAIFFYFAFCSEAKNRNTFLKLHFPGTAHLRDNVSHATNLKSNYLKTSLVRYFTYSSLADREVSYNSLYKSLHSFQLLGCVQFLTIWKQHFCTLMMEENLELNTPEWQKRAEDFLSMKEWTVAVSSPSPLIILANYQQQKPC